MHAYLLHGAHDLRFEERPRPVLASGQVLLRTRRLGICGSDVHYFTQGYIGAFVPRAPFALGHEFVGEVVELGPDVTAPALGTLVAVDPSMNCGHCRLCREGRYNLCLNMRYLGSASCFPHLDGSFAEFVPMPAANCFAIPQSLSLGEATLLEPLSVAMHGVNRAGSVAGKTVLVTGGGTIGQLVLRVARAFGAARLAVSDPAPFAREFALRSGADIVFNPGEANGEEHATAWSGGGFDVVIEAAGSSAASAAALRLARRAGTVVQIGTLPAEVPLPANLVMNKELMVVGSFRFAHVFESALTLAAAGSLDLAPLITATYPYAELPAAMDRAVSRDGVIKVQVEM
jgi:L-idonate 5-dehydrogenase